MVAKKIITKSIDDAINKCKPIYRASTINSFKKIADKNNLKILSDTDKNSFIELYDSKNKTKIIFTKDFINKNHIDLQDKNNKNINITELFEGYFDLPLKNKQDMNELLYTVDNSRKEEGVKAWTHLLTEDGHHHRVTIPDYVFEIDNPDNTNNYPYIMAHESMHAHDFIKLSEEQINHPEENKYLISNEDSYRFSAPYFNEDNYLVDTDYLK